MSDIHMRLADGGGDYRGIKGRGSHAVCRPGACLALALIVTAMTGCSSTGFNLSENIPWGAGEGGVYGKPMKIIAMWQDTVLHQSDRPPVRGFGGRIMFYGSEDEKPVKVAGALEVYAFLENDRLATNTKPDRKFVITPEEFEKHYSKNTLGHSYSVWVPWDQVGGEQAELSLIVRFTPSDGGAAITSEQTRHVLPGRKLLIPPKPSDSEGLPVPDTRPLVQRVAYEREEAPQNRASRGSLAVERAGVQTSAEQFPRMSTTTIDLPPTLMRHTAGDRNGQIQQPEQQYRAAAPSASPALGGGAPSASREISGPATVYPAQQSGSRSLRRQALGAPIVRLSRDHGPWRLRQSRTQFGQSPALGSNATNPSATPANASAGSR